MKENSRKKFVNLGILLGTIAASSYVTAEMKLPHSPEDKGVVSSSGLRGNFDVIKTHVHPLSVTMHRAVGSLSSGPGKFSAFAACPTGQVVVGGGCNFLDETAIGNMTIIASYPQDAPFTFNNLTPPTGWKCEWQHVGTDSVSGYSYVLCATISQSNN
ncbi:MAG: hypothetical protein KA712_13155 [Myxococcales bacterium]|nr:hypothetical protein [Myxococcales bacterium]